MRYVVAYDIASDAHRAAAADFLLGWGDRVQYSIFEVDVNARELETLISALDPHVRPPADRLRVWRLCAACQRATHAIGGAPVGERELAWIV